MVDERDNHLFAGGFVTRSRRIVPPSTPALSIRRVVRVVEALLHPLEHRFRLRSGLGGSPLFGGHGSGDGLAQFMLSMKEVR